MRRYIRRGCGGFFLLEGEMCRIDDRVRDEFLVADFLDMIMGICWLDGNATKSMLGEVVRN